MRIKSFYDKIGLSSVGAGLDGLFIHSDLTSWMDKLSPYFFFIMLKIAFIVVGIYLLNLYNRSKAIDRISLDKDDQLKKNNLLAKRVSQYHWYLLIILCFLSIAMNWGNAPGSGPGNAIVLIILWLLLVWPIIYFWKKNYTNPAHIVDLNNLTKREGLINFLFIEANKQYKKVIRIFLFLCIGGPITCAIFPSLIGETDSESGFGSCLLFILFITFLIWITSLFKKRKNNKIKNYYLSKKECNILASEESENSLTIKFDDKQIEVGKLFLPFSIEDCIQIINHDNYLKNSTSEGEKIENRSQISANNENDEVVESTSSFIDITEKYESQNTSNFPLLILFSILLLPLGFVFSFLYAYLMWYIPFPYFNFIIAAVFGVIIGFIFPIKLSKCTNSKVAIISVLTFTLICHYFGWITWMDLFINQSDLIEINQPKSPISSIVPSSSNLDQIIYMFKNPSIFLNIIPIVARDGYFSVFSFIPKGFSLYLIWLIELATILFFSAFTSYERSKEPFSVEKNSWLKSFKIQLTYISLIDKLNEALKVGDNKFFEDLIFPEKEDGYSEIEIWHLDDEQAYISIKNYKKRIDEKGKMKFDEQEFIKYGKINHEIARTLKSKL